MCGIAGVLHRDGRPASPVLLSKMADAIAHRGPDDYGVYVDGSLGLSHRRLSIIDLSSAGAQPMLSADGRFVLSYNGELYNFQELRRELEAKGRRFRSHSDTEVILEAFAAWGTAAVERFNGMFAFAVWDREEQRLTLARDRFGVKPLYYADLGHSILFGSEVKAILAHPDYRAEIDIEGLQEYFAFQNFFTERTLFKSVRLLPAGSWLQTTPGAGQDAQLAQYWDFNFHDSDEATSEEDYVEQLRHLFEQAVTRQLVSDVPVSSYLSGGIDSGSIACIAARQLPYMRSFTVGFDLHSASGLELAFDERESAEYMSYVFKTEHYEMVLKAGDMERCLSDLVWHLEEPRVGQSYPNFYAAKLASRFGKVVLAGTGGDEILGGYPWRYYRGTDQQSFETFLDGYHAYWQRLLSDEDSVRVLGGLHQTAGRVSTREIMASVFQHHMTSLTRPEDFINHSLYLESKTFLQGLLVVEDKLSMAHGLETRVPFLDNELVDLAARIPVRYKVKQLTESPRVDENIPAKRYQTRFLRTKEGKLIMRKAMASFLPDTIVSRTKQGFSAPDASWFRGESLDYVRDTLINKSSPVYDYLDRTATIGLIEEHLEGRQNRRLLIWSLLYFSEWCNRFLKDTGATVAEAPALRDVKHAGA